MASPPSDTSPARDSSARKGTRHSACPAGPSGSSSAAREQPPSLRWQRDLWEPSAPAAEGTGASGYSPSESSEQPNCERWRKLLEGALQEEGLGGFELGDRKGAPVRGKPPVAPRRPSQEGLIARSSPALLSDTPLGAIDGVQGHGRMGKSSSQKARSSEIPLESEGFGDSSFLAWRQCQDTGADGESESAREKAARRPSLAHPGSSPRSESASGSPLAEHRAESPRPCPSVRSASIGSAPHPHPSPLVPRLASAGSGHLNGSGLLQRAMSLENAADFRLREPRLSPSAAGGSLSPQSAASRSPAKAGDARGRAPRSRASLLSLPEISDVTGGGSGRALPKSHSEPKAKTRDTGVAPLWGPLAMPSALAARSPSKLSREGSASAYKAVATSLPELSSSCEDVGAGTASSRGELPGGRSSSGRRRAASARSIAAHHKPRSQSLRHEGSGHKGTSLGLVRCFTSMVPLTSCKSSPAIP